MTNKDRKNKVIQRQGNKGTEDRRTKGTEVIKDRVTREQKTEGHNRQSM